MSLDSAGASNAINCDKLDYDNSEWSEGVQLSSTTENTTQFGHPGYKGKDSDYEQSQEIQPDDSSQSFRNCGHNATPAGLDKLWKRTPLSERLELPVELLPKHSKYFLRRNQFTKNLDISEEFMNKEELYGCSSARRKNQWHLRPQSDLLGKDFDDQHRSIKSKETFSGQGHGQASSFFNNEGHVRSPGTTAISSNHQYPNATSRLSCDSWREEEETGIPVLGTPERSFAMEPSIGSSWEQQSYHEQSWSRKEFSQGNSRLNFTCLNERRAGLPQSRDQTWHSHTTYQEVAGNPQPSDDPIADLINRVKKSRGILRPNNLKQQPQTNYQNVGSRLSLGSGFGKCDRKSIAEESISQEELPQLPGSGQLNPIVKYKLNNASVWDRKTASDNMSLAPSETPGLLYVPSLYTTDNEEPWERLRQTTPLMKTESRTKHRSFDLRRNPTCEGVVRTLPIKLVGASQCTEEVWLSRLLDDKVNDNETARELSWTVPTSRSCIPVDTFKEFLTRYGIGKLTRNYLIRQFQEDDESFVDMRKFFDSLEVGSPTETFRESVYNTADKLLDMGINTTRFTGKSQNNSMQRSPLLKATNLPCEESSHGSFTILESRRSSIAGSVSFPVEEKRVEEALGCHLTEEDSLMRKFEGGVFVTKYPYNSSIFGNPKRTKIELVEGEERTLTWGKGGKKIYLNDIKKLSIGLRSETFKRFANQIINKGLIHLNQCMSIHTRNRTLDMVFNSVDEARDFKRYLETYLT